MVDSRWSSWFLSIMTIMVDNWLFVVCYLSLYVSLVYMHVITWSNCNWAVRRWAAGISCIWLGSCSMYIKNNSVFIMVNFPCFLSFCNHGPMHVIRWSNWAAYGIGIGWIWLGSCRYYLSFVFVDVMCIIIYKLFMLLFTYSYMQTPLWPNWAVWGWAGGGRWAGGGCWRRLHDDQEGA